MKNLNTVRKKTPEKTAGIEPIDVKFCTECQEQLDEFDLSDKAKSPEEVKKNFENCVKTGKFKGELCSKIFIANIDDAVWDEE